MTIRRATESDARMVAAIYNYYVVNSTSTFETGRSIDVAIYQRGLTT